MTQYIQPRYTPNRVKTAGKRLREGTDTAEDNEVLDNWRASHLYVINTFQASLRARAKGKSIQVAQRLKRKPTIIDKLRREPNMQLSTMQDLAGCRLIFPDVQNLNRFRMQMLTARFKHECRSVYYVAADLQPTNGIIRLLRREDRYNSMKNPKPSGYRGVHDVYRYNVKTEGGQIYNGMHIEVQYRTMYQHAWATAVEVADLLTSSRIKFSDADEGYQRFFVLASELIARAWEQMLGCEPMITDEDLISEFTALEARLGMLRTFQHLQAKEVSNIFKSNSILIVYFDLDENQNIRMEVENFSTYREGVLRYAELETQLAGKADVVLVRSDSESSMRSAFRNYFSDTKDFIMFVKDGIKQLRDSPMVG